jgi:hypothetical protein
LIIAVRTTSQSDPKVAKFSKKNTNFEEGAFLPFSIIVGLAK